MMLSPLHETLATIERQFDATRVNEIINHPDVLPFVQGTLKPPLDMAPAVADGRNVLLMGEHGGVIFHCHMDGLYEAHTVVLPEGRGRWTLDMARAAMHWMFTRTPAVEIFARCPKGSVGVKVLVKTIGGKYEFTNRCGWAKDGGIAPAEIYTLTIQDWMREAPGLVERGRWFQETMEREYSRMAKVEMANDEDLGRDRFVGAACEMILGDQVDKGVTFYNRWAVAADCAPLTVACRSPLAFNLQDALLLVRDGEFYIASIFSDQAA